MKISTFSSFLLKSLTCSVLSQHTTTHTSVSPKSYAQHYTQRYDVKRGRFGKFSLSKMALREDGGFSLFFPYFSVLCDSDYKWFILHLVMLDPFGQGKPGVKGFVVHVSAVKISAEEPKKVVSFVVADRGLAVQASLWTPIAERFGDKIAKWYDDEAQSVAHVRLVCAQVVHLARSPKVVVELQSVKKTCVDLPLSTVELQMQPDQKHLIKKFDTTIGSSGLTVNPTRIVSQAGEVTASKEAQRPMKDFELVDSRGASARL